MRDILLLEETTSTFTYTLSEAQIQENYARRENSHQTFQYIFIFLAHMKTTAEKCMRNFKLARIWRTSDIRYLN
jgi:hypothetical protein